VIKISQRNQNLWTPLKIKGWSKNFDELFKTIEKDSNTIITLTVKGQKVHNNARIFMIPNKKTIPYIPTISYHVKQLPAIDFAYSFTD
jgi:hypothetical protein